MKGKITSWNHDKGFGFIASSNRKKSFFVHISAFNDRQNTPKTGQWVCFRLSTDKKGRTCAINVSRRHDKKNWKRLFASLIKLILLTCSAIMLFFIKIPNFVLYIYAGMSFITFLVYALDKSAAKKGQWRTAENTLHFLALIGGWPGALLAQKFLRHKSKKVSFQIAFWFTFTLNITGLIASVFYFDKAYFMTLILSIKDLLGIF